MSGNTTASSTRGQWIPICAGCAKNLAQPQNTWIPSAAWVTGSLRNERAHFGDSAVQRFNGSTAGSAPYLRFDHVAAFHNSRLGCPHSRSFLVVETFSASTADLPERARET